MEEKMFVHVALTVNDPSEIEDFYSDILGLEVQKRFKLSKKLSNKLFGIDKNTEIVTVAKGDFVVEIFISDEKNYINFQHTCITVNNRDEVIEKVKENSYPYIIVEREGLDLVFIKDKSNNLFEVQQTISEL